MNKSTVSRLLHWGSLSCLVTLAGCVSFPVAKEYHVNPTMLNTVGKSIDIVLAKNDLQSERLTFSGYKFWSTACRDTGYVNTYRNNMGGYSSYREKRCGSALFFTDNNQIITKYQEVGAYIPVLNPVTSTYVGLAFDTSHPTFAVVMTKPYANPQVAISSAISLCTAQGGNPKTCDKQTKTFSNKCLAISGAYKQSRIVRIFWETADTQAKARELAELTCRKQFLNTASCKTVKSACAY